MAPISLPYPNRGDRSDTAAIFQVAVFTTHLQESESKEMSYEINDSLTDICPQCALKHLSAALACALDLERERVSGNGALDFPVSDWEVEVGVAIINVAEWASGYDSHLAYAVGRLARAEDIMAATGEYKYISQVREYRLFLQDEASQSKAVQDNRVWYDMINSIAHDSKVMAAAHAKEASRELPCPATTDVTIITSGFAPIKPLALISKIREAMYGVKEAFFEGERPEPCLPEPCLPEPDPNEQEDVRSSGEETEEEPVTEARKITNNIDLGERG